MQQKTEKGMPKRMKSIIRHIEENFIRKDNIANGHFSYIKSLLKQSLPEEGDDLNIAKILEAVHYIETIQVKTTSYSFFSKKENPITLAELMSQRGEMILPLSERTQRSINLKNDFEPILVSAEEQFGSLHMELVEFISSRYLKDKKTRTIIKEPSFSWDIDYPIDENQEVMNQSIGEWQAKLMKLDSNPKKAYEDFTRGISIRGIMAKSDNEVDDLLAYLIEGGSQYSPERKGVIKEWLKANGGQDINRFLDNLMLGQEFTPGISSALLNTESIQQNWSIENGKIVFSYEVNIYSIVKDGQILVNGGKSKLVARDPEEIKDILGNYNVLPLMRVKAKIELNLNGEDQVIPSITALNVRSYSSDLTKPTNLLKDGKLAM